jgi:putative peptidoglycan lipid II flippase
VWGLNLGVAGLALGTALGAWINVGILAWFGKSRALLAIESVFVRALPPALLAALATGAGAWVGARLGEGAMPGHYGDVAALIGAMICASLGYGVLLLLFRHRLPLGRPAQ